MTDAAPRWHESSRNVYCRCTDGWHRLVRGNFLGLDSLNALQDEADLAAGYKDKLIEAEKALAVEVQNCAQALFDMNQGRLQAETLAAGLRAERDDLRNQLNTILSGHGQYDPRTHEVSPKAGEAQ